MSYANKVSFRVIFLSLIGLLSIPFYFIMGGELIFFLFVRLFAHIIGLFSPIGYHRWLTHNQFEPNIIGKILLSMGIISSGLGSPLHHAIAHKTHHPHYDTNDDPHSPERLGFFKLWLGQYKIKNGTRPPKSFFRNKLGMFLHNYYWKIWCLCNIIIFIIFDLKTMLIFLPLNFTYSWLVNTLINYYGHYDPKTKTFGPRNTSKIFTLITAGEGLHKNHHERQNEVDFSGNGRKDPMINFIQLISKNDPNFST